MKYFSTGRSTNIAFLNRKYNLSKKDISITAIQLQPIELRQIIATSNASSFGFGIPTSAFHLSEDPSVVGTSGQTFKLVDNVPLDLYLVGPSADGPGGAGIEHNGTVAGIHFTATSDGTDITYQIVQSIRHHPGPGDWPTRSFDSIPVVAYTVLASDFTLLFP